MPAAPRALVTGGASGLGREAGLQLSQRGCHLIVVDRNVAGGEGTVDQIRRGGGSAEFAALDLGSLANIRAFAAAQVAHNEPIDILLNNAGLLPPKDRTTTED